MNRLRYIPLVISIITALIGLLVITGWYTQNLFLVQIVPGSIPMQFNTALLFLLISISVISLHFKADKISLAFTALPLTISLLTICEYIFQFNLGIDLLFHAHPFATVDAAYPGRISSPTATCFILISTALVFLNPLIDFRYRKFFIELFLASGLVVSAVSIFGFLTELPINNWTGLIGMPVQTAITFILLNSGVITYFYLNRPSSMRQIKHSPVLITGISSFIITLSLWQALVGQERVDLEKRIKTKADSVSRLIETQMHDRINALKHMANRREIVEQPLQTEWETDANAYLKDYTGLQSIEWLDNSNNLQWVVPNELKNNFPNGLLTTNENIREALKLSKNTKRTVITHTQDLAQGGKGFHIIFPIYKNSSFDGFIVGTFQTEALCKSFLDESKLSDFAIKIFDGEQLIFLYNDKDIKDDSRSYDQSLMHNITFDKDGLSWQIQVFPTSQLISSFHNHLPKIILIIGAIFSALLTLIVYLMQLLRTRAVAEQQINQDLLREISDRKQIAEDKAQLLYILEAATDFVGISTKDGQIQYLNRALRKLYGIAMDADCTILQIRNFHSENSRERIFNEAIPVAIRDGAWLGETEVKSADGKLIPVSQLIIAHKSSNGEAEFFSTIMRDITERTMIEQNLKEAKNIAEAATQAKAEFLANMSHEIRTPMNAVIGLTGLLLNTKLTEEQLDFVETIRNSGDALLTIINDILDFSKIESNKLDLEKQPFDLRNCIEQSLDLLASKAAEKDLELAYIIGDQTPNTIISDITRLRQILVNLLSNAVKFTERGEILISVDVEEQQNSIYLLHFAVKDTGIGIAKDRQAQLFKSFTQLDASTTRKYGGTGLGLAISKMLVELMGGTMWVESSFGKGSTFHFTLKAESSPSEKQIYLQSVQSQLSDKTILIIDDNETNRKILVKQAQDWGMITIAVASGQEALNKIKQKTVFDIAIFDMHMPEMDGISLALELRKYQAFATTPFIMLSSVGSQNEAKTSQAKFSAILTKPIKQSQLYNVLIKIFSKSEPSTAPIQYSTFDGSLADQLPLSILLAEDNVVNQKVATQILKRMGYRADVAANGLEVLEAIKRQPYDLILMDVQMPELDGIETTERICQLYPLAQRPRIVAMTASAMQGDKERCLAAGMQDYISKPVTLNELRAAIEKCPPKINRVNNDYKTIETRRGRSTSSYDPIDYVILDALRELQDEDNPTLISDLIDQFLSDAESKLEKMHKNIIIGNTKDIERAAHTLRSSSGSLGATQMMHICEEIENKGKSGSLDEVQKLLKVLSGEFKQVQEVLQREKSRQ